MADTGKRDAVPQPAAAKRRAQQSAFTSRSGAKKADRRADYDAPIGPWFEQLPADKRAPAEKLRALVEATVPDARSGLKWGVPFWTFQGKQLCDLVALKHEVALGMFAPPEAFDDPGGRLQGRSAEYRVLKVKHEDEIDPESVKRWLQAAVAAVT